MKRITAVLLALVLILSASGCVNKANTYVFKSKDNSWSIDMPKEFVKDKEEADEQQKALTTYFKTENETTLVISEIKDEKLVIDEAALKEELEQDHYIKVERFNTVEIKNFGKAYGAIVADEATGMMMMYYRLKNGDNAVSFIMYRKGAFTPEQEAKAIAMLSTFKSLKK